MDHIILPSTSSGTKRFEVPLLTSIPYDGNLFQEYPEHQGWGPKEIREWNAIFNEPPAKFLEFLQRWPFFGYLQTFFGVPIPLREFSKASNGDGRRVITTASLPLYSRQFLHRLNRMKDVERFTQIIQSSESRMCLHTFVAALLPSNRDKFNNFDDTDFATKFTLTEFVLSFVASNPMDSKVLMSICLLEEFSHSLLREFDGCHDSGLRSQPIERAVNTLLLNDTLLRKSLVQHGWCPSDVFIMFKQFNTSGLLFLDCLGPVKQIDNHWEKLHPKLLAPTHSSKNCTSLSAPSSPN
ncbi:hypothetical protein MMC14_009225 [Varicellaria rhodocarpa]|nr:hypothetical protein [Varicellaria rhodocarpa]